MLTCPVCGRENPDDARFCSGCGAPLAPAEPTRGEVRKTVTIVFSDVVGSTAVGERLDPESLRRVMGRYFDAMSAVLERHGATVEKFIGDAIMAVFGIPLLHEDDALRAVRAAAEMRAELGDLNDELERDYGVRIEARTGVSTGEVVAGDPAAGQRLVTGDAVNTAARLEQAAAAGEVLVGEPTWRLVRDAVEVEEIEPVAAKGKSAPVAAHRLLRVLEGVEPFARRFESPLVGRERELSLLRQAQRRAIDEHACHLFTVLGTAGIGKSRLVQEFLTDVGDDARIVVGRCLSYGEGITYWPLVEILEQLGNEDGIAGLLGDDPDASLILNRVLAAAGLAEDEGSPEERPWAIRKLFELLARERPLVVVFDDLQWAEPTFLDLVEHIADWTRDAAILVLCLARPELLDEHRAWGGGKLNATTILLEPLAESDADALIDNLLADVEIGAETRKQIATAAEGNPLFVEQMLAMLSEDGGGSAEVAVPPTIQALLAARLDRLQTGERDAIERASVVGKEFWQRALAELSAEPAGVAPALLALVRKELVRPHRSATFPREDAFRFRHLLIRDAAYAGLPKELRSELHERFADWLEAERSGFDEIVGYHLEQAYRYRSELGPLDERARDVGRRAGERLAAAGERAAGRYDMPAAVSLIERALEILPEHHARRLELRFVLGDALTQGGVLDRATAVLGEVIRDAAAASDQIMEWRARVVLATVQMLTGEASLEDAGEVVEAAVAVFDEAGHDAGLAAAYKLAVDTHNATGDDAAMEAAVRRGLVHARRARDVRLETELMFWLGLTAVIGVTPVREAAAMVAQLNELAATPLQRTHSLMWTSMIEGLAGDLSARERVAAARDAYADFGLRVIHGGSDQPHAYLELLAGNPQNAERLLREGTTELAAVGEKGYRSTGLAMLGVALAWQHRYDEAEAVLRASEAISAEGDAINDALYAVLGATLAAHRQDFATARELARLANELLNAAGSLIVAGESLLLIADAYSTAGKPAEAREAASAALRAYEAKGIVPGVGRARALVANVAPT